MEPNTDSIEFHISATLGCLDQMIAILSQRLESGPIENPEALGRQLYQFQRRMDRQREAISILRQAIASPCAIRL